MSEKRVRRIAEEIKKTVSKLILDGLKDPRIDSLASVTHVDLTNDYSIAKIYISTIDDSKRADTVKGLESAKGFIKREISKDLKLRIMPELIFVEDDSIERSFELFEKIEKVNEEHK